MAKVLLLLVVAFPLYVQPALAWDILVPKGALYCYSPFPQKEAMKAMEEKDEDWLISLGCGTLPVNTIATLIERPPPVVPLRMSKIRINKLGITVWMNNIDMVSVSKRTTKRKDHIEENYIRKIQDFIAENTNSEFRPSRNSGDVVFSATLIEYRKSVSVILIGIDHLDNIENNADVVASILRSRRIFWEFKDINDTEMARYLRKNKMTAALVGIPMDIAR